MADVDYPSQLPVPTRSNYGFQHKSPFQRTEMRTGRARQRRTFQYVPSIGTFELHLTTGEAQVFEAWFKYDITDGADWFNFTLETPEGESKLYECRFTEMYSGPILSALRDWRFTFDLELRERPIVSEDYYRNAVNYLIYSDVFDIAMNSKWPEA